MEQFKCMQVHCYPLAETRYAEFNMKVAGVCERECSRTIESVNGHQSAVLSSMLSAINNDCQGIDQAKNTKKSYE